MAELVNPLNPSVRYDRHWKNHDEARIGRTWEELKTTTRLYSNESLSRDTLGDDYQQLFVTLVLDHVAYICDCVSRGNQPEP